MSRRCLDLRAQSIARTFDNTPFRQWCKPSRYEKREKNTFNQDTKDLEGLLYVKVPKTVSSSIVEVAMRIHDIYHCAAKYEYTRNKGHDFLNHYLSKSFLIASIRKPSSQILSYIQFLNMVNKKATDKDVMNTLHGSHLKLKEGKAGYQFRCFSLQAKEDIPKFMTWSPENRTILPHLKEVHRHVRELVNEYDFLIVTERLDESLTAMALITDLDIAIIFIASSKIARSFNLVRCIYKTRVHLVVNRLLVTVAMVACSMRRLYVVFSSLLVEMFASVLLLPFSFLSISAVTSSEFCFCELFLGMLDAVGLMTN